MKVILSRKGFDSAAGGCASPIFSNGRWYSLPIPYVEASQHRYSDARLDAGLDGSSIADVIDDLCAASASAVRRDSLMHLDPDLRPETLARDPGWKPAFGQEGAQQSHLANRNVAIGDVFLFYGWYREVERNAARRWCWRRGSRDIHAVFGWLQVGEVIDAGRLGRSTVLERWPWLRDHPHVHAPPTWSPNVIYVAHDRLELGDGRPCPEPGGGAFATYTPRLDLTDRREDVRSRWRLPAWFKPGPAGDGLTNFPNPAWWTDDGDHVRLAPRGRNGQEAVLDCATRPEAAAWIRSLIDGSGSVCPG